MQVCEVDCILESAFIYSYVFIAIFSNLNSHTVTFAVAHFSFYDKSSCYIYNGFLILKILRAFGKAVRPL